MQRKSVVVFDPRDTPYDDPRRFLSISQSEQYQSQAYII